MTTASILDFGAIGDGVTDSSPAFQKAFDTLPAEATLKIPVGRYAINSRVSRTASLTIQGEANGNQLDVAGNGTGLDLRSVLLPNVGPKANAIEFFKAQNIRLEHLCLMGNPATSDDAHIVVNFNDVAKAEINRCEFYGLGALTGSGAIVFAYLTDLSINETAFLGCCGNSGTYTSIVQNVRWKGLRVSNTKFIDYGMREFYSKTPLAPPLSWVSIGNSAAHDLIAELDNVFLDEGAFIQLSALPAKYDTIASEPFAVWLKKLVMNVNNLRSSGMYLTAVDKVLIEDSRFQWSHNADTAVTIDHANDVILSNVTCVDGANTVRISADRVAVIDVACEHVDVPANALTLRTTNPIDNPVQFVRQQYTDLLHREPDFNGLWYWAKELLDCGHDSACITARLVRVAAGFLTSDEYRQRFLL